MSAPHILAIDQGTSGTKAILFNAERAIAASATRGLSCSFPRPGFVEQDPIALYRNVIESVRACVEDFRSRGGDPRDIVTCGISNQRETFLLWDDSGAPLCPAVSWQCERSVEICARLRAAGHSAEVTRRTGLLITPYFSATKLVWLMENDPTIRDAVRAGTARFGTIDTWLLYRLTNGAHYATDHTNASRTLLFSIDTLGWDEHLLHALRLEGLRLPPAHPCLHHYGETDFDGVLPRPIGVDAMIGDSHAAAFGEKCFLPGMAKVTLGTGSSILMDVGPQRYEAGHGIVSTICWSMPGTLHYALEGIIVSTGATIAWLRDQVGLVTSTADSETMANAVEDSGGVFVIPAFSGLGSPYWKMNLKASIIGLTFASGKNHIVRAALESIPFQIADVFAAMEQVSGVRPGEVRADGGMTANGFVMQMLADVLGTSVVTIGIADVSALGAATLAGLGVGIYRSLDELGVLPPQTRRLSAGPNADQAKGHYKEWKTILSNLP